MQITRETDYAIRCMNYLTRTYGSVTMMDQISREMCIPRTFLAKIVQKLVRAGIVRSYRGVKGGVDLASHPRKNTLLDVVEAVEGPVAMNVCAVDPKGCGFSSTCAIHPVWVEVRKKVENVLRNKNFADLAGTMRETKQ